MAPRRAKFISYGTDQQCDETKRFIEDSGILLDVREIDKDPFTVRELENLMGHLSVSHFLNTVAASYTKHGLDKRLPDRQDIIKLMVSDHTLIRRPIIKAARLITVGCDKKKISQMLQLNSNGEAQESSFGGNERARANLRPDGKKNGGRRVAHASHGN
jgi:arsenate reductase-like glutaredoxin family protein